LTAETHAIGDSESDNGSDEKEHINIESRGVSNKLVWQNMGSFPVSQKKF
jgi:hypothetical protein